MPADVGEGQLIQRAPVNKPSLHLSNSKRHQRLRWNHQVSSTELLKSLPTRSVTRWRRGCQPVDPAATTSMRDRLARARGAFSDAIGSVLGRSAIDDSVWEELEDALLIADVGMGVATSLLDPLREGVDKGDIDSPDALIAALRESMIAQLAGANRELAMRPDEGTSIWLFVGVNGVGKTTTIGK